MYARFQDRDIHITSAKVNWALNQAADFELKIPLQELNSLLQIRMRDIEIYRRGVLFLKGFISDSPEIDLDESGVIVVKLNGFSGMGELTRFRAKSESHYQDIVVLDILEDLLTMTNGSWELGDTSTMVDPIIPTTIDLRQKEELFAQIVATIKAVPDVHIRYGGMVDGIHQIDVGNFNQETEVFQQGHNLLTLKRKRVTAPFYSVVEAYGNWAGSETVLSLQNALADARTTMHPDYDRYPITFDAVTNTWILSDTQETEGSEVTQFFSLAKTKNDEPPTAAQIAEAGYALWLKAVRFLKSHVEHEEYSSDVYLDHVPVVGDKARIHSTVVEPVFDPVTREVVHVPIFEVRDSYRITSVDYSFEEGLHIGRAGEGNEILDMFSADLTSSDEAENIDPVLQLYDKLEDSKQFDNPKQVLGFDIPPPVTVTHGPLDAVDCIRGGGITPNAKTFTVTSPVPPTWVDRVSVTWTFSEDVEMDIVQNPEPNNPGDDLIFCVQDSGSAWPPAADISVTAQFVFTKD